jgi:ParB-like chromosome segregation protein Spo0J
MTPGSAERERVTHTAVLKPPIDVAVSALLPNYERLRLVRPREYALMHDSVQRFGQISPAAAGRVKDDTERYELVDGFKRYRACVALGIATMKIQVIEGGVHALKAAIINLNRCQATLHAFEEALVVHSLYREDTLAQKQIAVLFGRHKSWACRRIALCERLCDEAVAEIRLGLLGFATARQLCRLPRGNQAAALACVHKHRLSSHETAQLVSRLLQSPRWEQESILHLPLDILEQRHAVRAALQTDTDGYTCLCATLDSVCTRIAALDVQRIVDDTKRRDTLRGKIARAATSLNGLKAALP